MTSLIHTAGQLVAGIELLTDLTLAGVALMLLGRIADAIRLVYRLGRFCGWAWFRYGQPTLLRVADGISYVNSLIDWTEVRDTVRDCLKVIVSAIATVVTLAWDLRCEYIRRNTTQSADDNFDNFTEVAEVAEVNFDYASPVVPVTPAINPLATVADNLMTLPRKQLMTIAGTKRRLSKQQLVTLLIAA